MSTLTTADTDQRSERYAGPVAAAISTVAAPLAPVYGVFLAYLIFHAPRRPYHRTPADVGLPNEQQRISTPDGKSIHLWICRNRTDKVIVLGHGIGLSKAASLPHAKLLFDAGYTVVLFDHRNHGLSSRDRACWSIGPRYTADVAATLDYVAAQPEFADARIATYGFSFSTFASLYVLRDGRPNVAAVICDSGPVLDVPAVQRGFLAAGKAPVPGLLRAGPARKWLERSLGRATLATLGVPDWPPRADGRYATTPMLFLAGDRDTIVTPDNVAEVSSIYPGAELKILKGAAHLDGIKVDRSAYADYVLDFLARTL